MSKEALKWLNTQTLIGFTEKRGNAWHYRVDLQSAEPNHYPGPVPVEDVRRPFSWEPELWEVYARKPARCVSIPPDCPSSPATTR